MKCGNSGTKGATTATGVDTLIGRQTEILGDIRFSGGLHIDGKVKGKVLASGDKASALSVSESGAIEGDVRVPNIMLNGSVSGDVYVREDHARDQARVTGNVYYKIIEVVAPGSTVARARDDAEAGHYRHWRNRCGRRAE